MWCESWCMEVNADKCSLWATIILWEIRYTVNGKQLTSVETQKDLRIIVSEDLKLASYVGCTIKRANRIIYLISKAFTNILPELLVRIIKIYIRPIVNCQYSKVVKMSDYITMPYTLQQNFLSNRVHAMYIGNIIFYCYFVFFFLFSFWSSKFA